MAVTGGRHLGTCHFDTAQFSEGDRILRAAFHFGSVQGHGASLLQDGGGAAAQVYAALDLVAMSTEPNVAQLQSLTRKHVEERMGDDGEWCPAHVVWLAPDNETEVCRTYADPWPPVVVRAASALILPDSRSSPKVNPIFNSSGTALAGQDDEGGAYGAENKRLAKAARERLESTVLRALLRNALSGVGPSKQVRARVVLHGVLRLLSFLHVYPFSPDRSCARRVASASADSFPFGPFPLEPR